MLKTLIVALALVSTPMAPVLARGVDTPGLLRTVDSFETAMGADDFRTVIGLIPEKVFARMAAELDVTPEHLTELVAAQMEKVLDDVTIVEFGMETDDIAVKETENGVSYVFLPTRTVVAIHGAQVETRSHTLALREGEEWRLVRIDDDAQLRVLREAYPGFVGIEFPRATTKILN